MANYPCNQKFTDIEYINHMITHHEVAVYMSENQLPITKNPKLLDIFISGCFIWINKFFTPFNISNADLI